MLRHCLTIIIAKLICFLSRLAHKQGVTLSGAIALKLDPSILTYLTKQVKNKTIVVCGTNGKTTTNNLLALALKANGFKVLCNYTGSNMLNGIASAYILNSSITGKLDIDYACLEIDEASARHVFKYLQPDYLILTNLFRDQLDRYGEIDITMDLLKQALALSDKTTIIFNGDDIVSTQFVLNQNKSYYTFGICYDVMGNKVHNDMKEGQFCYKCNHPIKYNYYHYAQLGDFYCPNCGFKRLPINLDAKNISYEDKLSFTINDILFNPTLRGFYNVYNHLAVSSLLSLENLSIQKFADSLETYHTAFGRQEIFNIDGCKIFLNLAKNPAGMNQNIDLATQDKTNKDIIIAINDNEQDGIDVSWLWDVDFDQFKNSNVDYYYTCGLRYMDMALRLKYVDINCTPIESINQCIEQAITNSTNKNIYVLVNYTALYPTSLYLNKRSKS